MPVAPANGHIFQALSEAVPVPIITGTSNLYFLGIKDEMLPGPEAFLADCIPDHEIDSHFHRVDQYQIMFGSPGAYYQRTKLPKALLHYSDAYSVYGPFGTGPESNMHFFTLRGAPSNFHGSMPKDRDELIYRGRRHHQIDLQPLLDEPVRSDGEVTVDVLIPPESDGLAAYMMRFGPAAEATPPDGELRTGRYCIVLEGELHYDDRAFGPKSLGWSSGRAPQLALQGGPDGAAVVFLHMPYPVTTSVRPPSA